MIVGELKFLATPVHLTQRGVKFRKFKLPIENSFPESRVLFQ
jgi:hypothetical protein